MSKPTKEQRRAAVKIAARYTKNCTAQVALLIPCYSSNMGPCSDCRRRSNLTREIAQALADQTSAQAVDAEKLWEGCEANYMGGYGGIEYEAFKHGMRTVCNVIAGEQAVTAMRKRSDKGEVDAE